MACVICGMDDKQVKFGKRKGKHIFKPEPGTYFTCGTCVQHLMKFDQSELEWGYLLAMKSGHKEKAIAIQTFMENKYPEEETDAKTREPQSDMARTRTMRPPRSTRN